MLTWLPDAVNHGAEVFTRASVSHLERAPNGGWRVYYEPVGFARGRFDEAPLFVTASVVVLGAGSLGSTGILLRSRDRGLPLSGRLGKGFTGNGDVLGFTYNGNLPVGSVGIGQQDLDVDPPGPTITGAVDLRNTDAFRDGMIIQEGAIPSPLAPLMPLAFKAAASMSGKDGDGGVAEWLSEHKDRIESLVQGSYEGRSTTPRCCSRWRTTMERGRSGWTTMAVRGSTGRGSRASRSSPRSRPGARNWPGRSERLGSKTPSRADSSARTSSPSIRSAAATSGRSGLGSRGPQMPRVRRRRRRSGSGP